MIKVKKVKQFAAVALALIFILGTAFSSFANGPGGISAPAGELRGVWISYLDWNSLPKEETAFQKAVDSMMDNCVSKGLNAVFVHVRPDGDAMYPSSYFPWSKFASGYQYHETSGPYGKEQRPREGLLFL